LSPRPKRIALALGAAAMVLAGVGIWRNIQVDRDFRDPRLVLSRFPPEDSLVFSANVALLRRTGLLGPDKTAPEPEYKAFLDGTGFDYRRDLDSLTAAFSRTGSYFILRGRFNWKQLQSYADHNGGSCYQQLCRMQGSTPERRISYLPLRQDAMALAVSTSDLAATRLTKTGDPVTSPLPSSPVWISVPGSELRRQSAFAPNLRFMLSALGLADRVVVTFDATTAGIEAHLEATCRTDDNAKVLASQLRIATSELKEAQARAKDDPILSVLTTGSFDQSGRKVSGTWPLPKNLLDSLLAGI
jgi:hypothetical protein